MTTRKINQPLPSIYLKKEIELMVNKYPEWFYNFEFVNGASTKNPDQKTNEIHTTRAGIIFPFLDELYEGKWQQIDCLDIACNQGWFSSQIAIRGAHQVTGIDIRESHIKMANTIKDLTDLTNLNFKVQDFLEIDATSCEKADLVLFLGILYHLDNPLQAIRKIRSLTKNLCIIETQVAKSNPELECCWGSDPQNRKGPALALIESDKGHGGSDKPLVLVPTLNALYRILFVSGFEHLFLGIPTETMEEQFQNFDRVIIFALVDD
jgi:2-polyprenyl-3-methyl-5-hydroxy-6-metoxy-1,4-benzoquinol methylase